MSPSTLIAAENFIHANLNSAQIQQTLDHIYCKITHACKDRPHLGLSDHPTLSLISNHSATRKQSQSGMRKRLFAEGTKLEGHSTAVLSYINVPSTSFFPQSVSQTKTMVPWQGKPPSLTVGFCSF